MERRQDLSVFCGIQETGGAIVVLGPAVPLDQFQDVSILDNGRVVTVKTILKTLGVHRQAADK